MIKSNIFINLYTFNIFNYLITTRCCQDRLECALQSTQFAQSATEEQLERAHARIEELKLTNNKLNDQLINEQEQLHKFHNNTIATDHQLDTLKVSILTYL